MSLHKLLQIFFEHIPMRLNLWMLLALCSWRTSHEKYTNTGCPCLKLLVWRPRNWLSLLFLCC